MNFLQWRSVPALLAAIVCLSNLGGRNADEAKRSAPDPATPLVTGWEDLLEGVTNRDDWREKRTVLRKRFLQLIGDDAKPTRPPLDLKIHESQEVEGAYVRHLVSYQVEADERAWAFLAVPVKVDSPAPAIVALHGTGLEGKEIAAGLVDRGDHRGTGFLDLLARRGYVVIAPDHFNMGQRLPPERTYHTDSFYKRHPKWTALGKIAYDTAAAIDVLLSRKEVNPKRIGAIGHSLGGIGSLYLAAYDERVQAIASVHGSYPFRFNSQAMEMSRPMGKRQFVYFPQLRKTLERGQLPAIDMHEIIALIAPRPLLDVVSLNDKYNGDRLGHRRRAAMNLRIADVYQLYGSPENYAYYVVAQKHSCEEDTRALACAWLGKHLKTTPKDDEAVGATFRLRFKITSKLPAGRVPVDPEIDFATLLSGVNKVGVFDPNSVRIVNVATGKEVPHLLHENFAQEDKGHVQWVVDDPLHRDFEIYFRTAKKRTVLRPSGERDTVPLIGTGDLLRYNAGEPRPIAAAYQPALADVDGDGKADLVGTWNYAYRPGQPWSGVICHPRVGKQDDFLFGERAYLHWSKGKPEAHARHHFSGIYATAEFADLNGDGRVDIVFCPREGKAISFYLNSGQCEPGGMPIFTPAGSTAKHTSDWESCRVVDLDIDGSWDIVVGNTFLRNKNEQGWPFDPNKPVTLDAGRTPCFYDVDRDGLLDAVCLVDGPLDGLRVSRIAWRKNNGASPPEFGKLELLDEINAYCKDAICAVSAVHGGQRRGLLVQHDVLQMATLFEDTKVENGRAQFRTAGTARSDLAVISLSDQAWPHVCDWDGDGDLDLLAGGGYGWPRILLNEGTTAQPAFSEANKVLAEGKPIRLLRNEILGGEHWHNMGYPLPAFVDWDGDGRSDLLLPNETNRIFWYQNKGPLRAPKFGSRLQLLCDGFPDSPDSRTATARLTTKSTPYPSDPASPFHWRTGAAFADFNGDGLCDLVTHDSKSRQATLFVQYRNDDGTLKLKRHGPLRLQDGRAIDDRIVGRTQHWTESFRPVDWDGDGLLDLIYSCAGSSNKDSIYLLRNVGTKTEPVFAAPRTFCFFGQPIKITNHGPHPWVGDFDGDGKPDLLACVEWSVYPFYCHNAIEMPVRPRWELAPLERLP